MKHVLTGKWILAIVMVAGMIFTGRAYASHTMGADLTYENLGGNTYKITVSFYRDCIGIPAPANPFVTINSSSCGQSLGVTCYPRPGTGQEVTPSCSSSVTTCSGGSFTGIQEWIYDGIITLPAQCNDWIFGYSLCCRNAAITTVTNPSTSTFYIYATLNNTITPENSSPTFSNKPVPFLCLGQQFCFNHGAYDADGDSLVYSLITPKQTISTDVNYRPGYSASNPLISSPATSFNTATGDICLTPQALEVTVMAVLVSEYRNGVMIGSVERDLQLTVMNCANNLPSLTGINGTNVFNMTICANQPTCFDIFSNDPDNGQQLTVDWNSGIAGGTFNASAAGHPVGTFCWTPSPSDIGNTYSFTATVTDDACPYNGSQTYSYTINVIGINVNAGPDQAIACSDLATLTAIASGGTGIYTYQWNNGSTMQSITVGAGTYIVTASDGTCIATDTVEVTMPFIPVAAFTNSSPDCDNSPIIFTDQSTTPGGTINYWYWLFGDGDSSLVQNPVHQFPGPGTYNVTLIIENNLGCRDTIVNPLVILPLPVADFSWGLSCINIGVVFADITSSSPTSWTWSFGDGTFSNQQYPTHVYNTSGTFTVTLIAGNSIGCTDTISYNINVLPLPVASAGIDQIACAGDSVTLTAAGGLAYNWMPGGQTTQVITVTPSGSSTLIVTVTDGNGCYSTDTVDVIVNPLPNINAGADQGLCIGSSVTLSATGAVSYSWSPGGSTSSSISVNPATATSYTVTGTSVNGCSATDVINITVNPIPTADAGTDIIACNASNTILTASGGVSYLWLPGGMTNQSITVNPTLTQTYEVTVTDANGCTANDSVTVSINQRPTVTLQSFFLCAGSTATLDAGNPGSDFLWSNGDTTQTTSINTGGNYSVTVTDSLGCSTTASCMVNYSATISINLGNVSFCQGDSVLLDAGYAGMNYVWTPGGQTTQTIFVNNSGSFGVTVTDTLGCIGSINISAFENPLPVPEFSSVPPSCQGNQMSFNDASTVSSGTISGWSWNFDDGGTSSIQNPNHIFPTAGNFNVTLTATTNSGCTASVSHPTTVNPLPVPAFTYSNTCLGNVVSFTDQSTVSSGNIVSYNWTFGDTNTSSQQNPLHTYASSGNYSVNLTVTTAGGCSQSVNQTVTVNPNPTANFTAPQVCLGNATIFTNSSSIATGGLTGFSWDFNDTYTSSQNSPSHTFSSAGTYSVRLIVNSSFGCSDTVIRNVIVNALPVANAGVNQAICSGNSAILSATGGISYSWSPGGSAMQSISVSPSGNTTYTVTVTNASGCTSTDAVAINVNPIPNAVAGTDRSICNGGSVNITGSGGTSYLWSPGGMTTNAITVNPASTTNYILTVTDANGCTDKDTVAVTVYNIPVVVATPDNVICSGSTTSLVATGATSYSWSPVGLSTSTILVTPASTTTYTVVGTGAGGCTSSDVVTITVNTAPIINMPTALLCDGFTVTLDAGNPGSAFDWSTGESTQTITVSDSGTYSVIVTSPNGCPALGSTSVLTVGTFNNTPVNAAVCSGQNVLLDAGNPGSTYQWSSGQITQTISVGVAGNYSVTVTDINGCVGTLLNIVGVNPLPVTDFTSTTVCSGEPVVFNNISSISSGTISGVLWDFGDGNNSATSSVSHLYSTHGNYTVTLTATSSSGCTSSVSHQATVNPLPVPDFSSNPTCENLTVSFTNASSIPSGSITQWNWDFGDGATSNAMTPTHDYSSPGTFNATLIATSAFGCADTINRSVTILGIPDAAFTASNGCAQSNISLTNNSSPNGTTISSYEWNFGNGNSSTSTQPILQYAAAGTFQVSLIAVSTAGCRDTAFSPLTIYPLPVADFTASPVCVNTSAAYLNNSTISSGVIQSYYWTLGDNSTSTITHPYHSYTADGTYNVTVIATSSFGCRDTAIKPLTIFPEPQVSITGQDVCNGNNINFTNNTSISSGSINSWSWNFNDGSSSIQTSPVHQYNSTGTFTVNLTAVSDRGCQSSAVTNVNIFPNPVAAFTTVNVCFGSNTQLINQSSITGGGNLYSSWTFSDGSTSTSNNPVHLFSSAGNFSVTLQVTSPNGCVHQLTKGMDVYHLPVAQFSAPDNCSGTPVSFTNQSTSQDGHITSFLWGFGDGTFSFQENPVHQYSDSGQYNVDLITITSFGCAGDYSDSISIFSKPVARIQANNACVGSPISFIGSSDLSGGVSYSWSIGSSFNTTQPSFNYTFNSPGNYSVTLVATSTNGCSGTHTDQVSVYPNPMPAFSAGEVCYASQTAFNNLTTTPSGTVSSYSWNFGDNQQSSQSNPSHTYTSAGTFNAMLTVSSDRGCTSIITNQVVVHPIPVVNFSSGMQGCKPINATFTESSSISSGNIIGHLWNFGDGEVSTDLHPIHVYDQSGTYNVTLTVVSDFGCQASAHQPNAITVFPNPVADFSADPMVTDIEMPIVNFQNESHGYSAYQWVFGDGTTTSNELNPTHTFTDTGTFSALLITVNNFGCRDSIMKYIEVKLHSTLYIANCFTPNGDGNNDDFRPYQTNMKEIKVWIFDRWGKLLTSWVGLDGSWDGFYNGKKCQTDTYVYKIAGTGLDGKQSEWVGHVSIVY